MPIIKSAQKRLRQTVKRQKRNSIKQKAAKSQVKNVLRAIAAGDSKKTAQNYNDAQSKIDRLAKKHLVHKNKAARQKAKLAKKVHASLSVKKPQSVSRPKKSAK